MQANIKTKNREELQLKILVNSKYTHTEIDKQLVKKERIKMKPAEISFKVFNVNGIKNGEVTRIAPLKFEINRHKEQIEVAVIDLNSIDIFLEYNWLVKHNLKVNWKKDTIWFTRYLRTCKTKY